MHYKTIAKHMRPYIMLSQRRTTINHAFASALAPHDQYDDSRVRSAIQALGQDPDIGLKCAYCGHDAETWDHINATVKDSKFSGHGHRLGNLLPCCKPCNSRKGNKDWRAFINLLRPNSQEPDETRRKFDERYRKISEYIANYEVIDAAELATQRHLALAEVHQQVLALLAKGDEIAALIRKSEQR